MYKYLWIDYDSTTLKELTEEEIKENGNDYDNLFRLSIIENQIKIEQYSIEGWEDVV